jgi:hypothetical protein
MFCALTVRKLKPGTGEDFVRAFVPEEGAEVPAGWKRFYALRNVADENEMITFGFFEGSLEELRASQEESANGEGYRERRAAIDELVESVGADGVFEIVEERSMG